MPGLSAKSRAKLRGVHPDLVRVVERAADICPIPFEVTEGLRTLERQKQLKRQGLSKTLNSRHLTGHAVDLVPVVDVTGDGKVTGEDMWHHAQLVKLSPFIKRAFAEERVPYEWGGDWKNAWDKPHWQLPWKRYPIRTASVDELGLMEALVEDPMETDYVTPSMSTMLKSGGAGLGGAGLLADAATQLQQADSHFSARTTLGLVVGGLIVAGALWTVWTTWDDAGRPCPLSVARRLPAWLKLNGAPKA
jgi:peptidoglycan LD-endopeptidase CwlK